MGPAALSKLLTEIFGSEERSPGIAKKHPSLLPLVGEDLSRAETSEARTALAEIVAEALVSQIVTEKHGDQRVEASILYESHRERLTRLCLRSRRGLGCGPTVNELNPSMQ